MFFDAGHGGSDQSADGIDRRHTGSTFRPAAQTGPETGTFCSCRIRIKAHIQAIRRPRRANRPAIDMRRGDSHKKPAVKAAIAGPYRTKTSIGVEVHGARLAPLGGQYSPFSDLDMVPCRGHDMGLKDGSNYFF